MQGIEFWTLVAVAAAGVLFAVFERRFPYNPGQGLLRTGFWTDFVLYCLVQSYVMGLVIGRLLQSLDTHTGASGLGIISGWPIPAQLAFFVVTHDIYIYFFHRWQHRSPLLWRLHEAHHSVPEVDWLSGVRSHSLEILINQTIEFAPIVLLGAAPEVAVLKGAVSAIWGMFIHANLDVDLGPLRYLINGPRMHRWHHANEREAYDKNFGTKLVVWDWLFGTAYLPDGGRRKATRYGLSTRVYPEAFPFAYLIHHAYPFMPAPRSPEPPVEL